MGIFKLILYYLNNPIFDYALDVEDWYAQVIQGNNSNYIDKQDKLFI